MPRAVPCNEAVGKLLSPSASPVRSRRRQAPSRAPSEPANADPNSVVATHVLKAAQRVEAHKKLAAVKVREERADEVRRSLVNVQEQAAKAEERVRARLRQAAEEKQRVARRADKSKESSKVNAEEERIKAEQRVAARRKQATLEQQAATARAKEEREGIDSKRSAQQHAKEQRRAKIYALNRLMRLSREQRAISTQHESI